MYASRPRRGRRRPKCHDHLVLRVLRFFLPPGAASVLVCSLSTCMMHFLTTNSRVPKEQGVSQPVYEAWVLCMSHETGHEVKRLTSYGFNILSAQDEEAPWVSCRAEPHGQQELSDMTLAAVGRYQAANKRCLASRLFRGQAKSYEKDVDKRIQRLPLALQSELNSLLRRREEATSSRFHRRDWTVALMREQYRYRFANAEPEEVKRSGFWKKKDQRRIEYLFIIRGADGKVGTDDKGRYQPREFGNPWKRVDEHERRERERARDMRAYGKGYLQNGWYPRPRGRSLSPMPIRSPPPPPPAFSSQPDFDDYPPPPRRVRVERSRSRSPSFTSLPNESFTPYNPFVPAPLPGGMVAPPTGPFSCGLPPEAPEFHMVPQGGCPHLCQGECGLPGPHVSSFLQHPPLPSGLPPPCISSPRPILPSATPSRFEMPSSSENPYFPQPINCPYPFDISSPQTPPPSHLFRYMDYTTDYCASALLPPSPPPAPRPSNLTTPTSLSRATTNHTGSTIPEMDVTTSAGTRIEMDVGEEGRTPNSDDGETGFLAPDRCIPLTNKEAFETNE